MIHTPPQHGKSIFVSVLFSAFCIGLFPDDPIILTAYSDEHATTFSRRVRNLIASPEYQTLFPTIQLADDSQSAGHWELAAPLRAEFHAAGIMGSVTGRGAKVLIIDDPIKNRAEAESKTYRTRLIDAYKSTLSTRLHRDAIEICMMTRWHENDLAGWLMKESGKNFRYIKLPAICENGNDPIGRKQGEALWGDHFPEVMLLEQQKSVGTYEWYAIYQGEPRPPEGSMFKKNYFTVIEKAPDGLKWVRYWDLATSTKESADFTASVALAQDNDANIYLRDMYRGKWEWPDVRAKIKTVALAEPQTWHGIESAGTQKGMVQEIWRDTELVNIGITGVPVHTDKRIRALPCQTRGEAGKLYLVKGDWNDEFIQECMEFPNSEHDDQVDTMSGGFQMLSMTTGAIG